MSRISDALVKSGGYLSIAKYEQPATSQAEARANADSQAETRANVDSQAEARATAVPWPEPQADACEAKALGLEGVPVEEIGLERLRRVPMITDSRGGAADRFRFLRLRLLEAQKQKARRKLLVTSPLPKDGKSTVALNLATAMADAGKRTILIVDADLHHSAVSERLGLKDRQGLAECLESGIDPMSAIVRLEPLACYFLPGGAPSGNPTELLQSNALGSLIATLSARFDWMIVDSPPVAPFTDALSLKKEMDATLLVVRAGKTPSDAVEEAMNLLGREHVAAIALNSVEGLERKYSKYYKYYSSKK